MIAITKRRLGVLIVATSLLMSSVAYALDRVKVGIANTSSDIAFFIADKKGYFRDEDIQAEFIAFPSATQMIAPLAVGDLDVGAGAPGAGLYNAAARDISIRIVADKGSMPKGHGYFSLIVRKDLVDSGRIKTIADLKGMKVGDTSKQGSGDVTLNELLKKSGLKFDDVEAVYMGPPQLVLALQNKAIDATLITEPSLSIAIANGSAVLFAKGDEIYPNQQLAVTLYGGSLLKRRDLAQRFMNAYVRAARFYNEALQDGKLVGPHGEEVIDMLIERTNLKDRAQYAHLVPNGLNPNGCANAEGLRHDYRFYAEMGWVKSSAGPDALIDDSFCKAAVEKLGSYKR